VNLPLLATNDAHYLSRSDHDPHDVLLCIGTGKLRSDEGRLKFSNSEFYLKSPEEMGELFKETPEALENTARIADMCNLELAKEQAPMPQPEVPEGVDSYDFLIEIAKEGLLKRAKNPESKLERLEYELGVIKQTKFADYFLLVKEFAQATRDRGIFFGVRGSAAGSLVSYALGITDVDPVDYDLTFERFLNPERISMPDIDMDFEDARRDEIIDYVTERFGRDHVAQIITFGTLGAKAALKDSGRVQGYTPQETDRLCKAIPTLPGWNLDRAYNEIKEFHDMIEESDRYRNLFKTAKSVEGIARHAGVHAAGIVISRDPLVDYVPLYKGNDGQAITAYEMGMLEKIGLLKMDFLGLSNLTVLARTVENVKQTRGIQLDVQNLPEHDEATFEMLGRGETAGVFQLEGGGMTRWVMELKPNSVRELAAMIALYRPGPMEHIPQFIDTKFGRRQAVYLDERMRPLLEETYGVIVYQDQVLKLVQALAGFSLGQADILRRAMGKKDAKAMAEEKVRFMAGTGERSIKPEDAETLWKLLEPFAGYAFNKAHAVCYSILAYQTAYLKANYPIEYMAALLAVYRTKEDRVTSFIEECRRKKIAVLQPDVNASRVDFSIEGDSIRFGLAAIKGVGEAIVQATITEREKSGPFTHLYEFCERMKPHGLNRTAVEALVKAGAFDTIDSNRQKLLDRVDGALQFADSANRDRLAGQVSLFGEASGIEAVSYPVLPDCDRPGRAEILVWEKEVMGIYVSDHPLRGHERSLRTASTHTCVMVEELEERTPVKLAGVIASLRAITTKKGDKMATFVLEDFSGQVSVTCFPATYTKLGAKLEKDEVVSIHGFVSFRERPGSGGERSVEIRLEDITPLAPRLDLDVPRRTTTTGLVSIRLKRATPTQVSKLCEVLAKFPGGHEVMIEIEPVDDLPPIYPMKCVQPGDDFSTAVRRVLPGANVQVLQSPPEPTPSSNGSTLITHEIPLDSDPGPADPEYLSVG
jgi:DNA polymerase-3 subunit alpha